MMLRKKRKEENKKYLVIIVILSLILAVALFFDFAFGQYYFKNINKSQYGEIDDNKNSCQISSSVKNKITYILDKRKAIEFDKYGEELLDKSDGTKYINYPVFIGEDESILELNDTIKLRIEEYIDKFYLDNEIENENIEDKICYVKTLEDGSQKEYCEYLMLEYSVYENKDYINILENEVLFSYDDNEYRTLNNVYTIDKSKGIVISNEDMIKEIDNISLIKNSLVKYIKENYSELSISQKWEIRMEDFIADLDILLSTNSFSVFVKDNDIYLYFRKVQGIEEIVFRYTGNKIWEEVSGMYE